MKKLVIGKYIRLSQSDRDLIKKKNKTESESISHQRALIQQYMDANPSFTHCKQYEFLDDGYSGTNFGRPGFEGLIEKVKQGEINCIIVKDFSRFGRNYIELGDYLERIFPFLGVRFISINDHYDSADYKGTTGGLDIAMKNIVYDFYSKDLSVKVLTGKRTKMKQGLYSGAHTPYGLKKHDKIKGKLIIDEEAASIIRKIFKYAIEGFHTSTIARMLNEESILTPGQYYLRKNPNSKKFRNQSQELSWSPMMIRRILQQEMYYGAVVGHKRENVAPCSMRTRAVPKEEQIIVEEMHEAIVTKEQWLQAQSVIHRRETRVKNKRDYALKGKARCGYCGRMLWYSDKRNARYFKCMSSNSNSKARCRKNNVHAAPIELAVWHSLQMIFTSSDKLEKRMKQMDLDKEQESLYIVEQIPLFQRKLKEQEFTLFLLMEQLNDGILSKTVFLEKKSQIKCEIDRIRTTIEKLEQEKQEMEAATKEEVKQFIDSEKKYWLQEELSMEMIQTFIEAVMIFDNEHIEIKWNCSDELLKELAEKP